MSSDSAPAPDLREAAFRRVCGRFATGVAIATLRAPDGSPHGITVNSFTSVSLRPPLILVCIDQQAASCPFFAAQDYFAINILRDTQQELSVRFAQWPEGRFDGIKWRAGAGGAPVLEGSLAALECRKERILRAGDHQVIFGEVLNCTEMSGSPLLYFGGAYRQLA
jgi:flavin reductase (DIM6/NTAB) family NADH-FMN oxidoreductase RutF